MGPWASLVQKNISPSYLAMMKEKDERISLLIDIHRLLHQKSNVFVNDREADMTIISREKNYIGESREKKFYRKRKVPQKKNKNYPTKPKETEKINGILDKAIDNHMIMNGN